VCCQTVCPFWNPSPHYVANTLMPPPRNQLWTPCSLHGHVPKHIFVVKILCQMSHPFKAQKSFVLCCMHDYRLLPGSMAVLCGDLTSYWDLYSDILAGFLWGVCWPSKMKGHMQVATHAHTGACCVHHEGRWCWRQQAAVKFPYTFARSYYITSQKSVVIVRNWAVYRWHSKGPCGLGG
jgi:hypothetical protein